MPKMVESYSSDSLSFFMLVSQEKYLCDSKRCFLATLLVFCEKESNMFAVSALIVSPCLDYGIERLHPFTGTGFVFNVPCASG